MDTTDALPFVDYLLQFPGHLERSVAMHSAMEQIGTTTNVRLILLRPCHPTMIDVCLGLQLSAFSSYLSAAAASPAIPTLQAAPSRVPALQ